MSGKDFFHEIRNRITILKGNLDLIDERKLGEEDRKFLREASLALKDLTALISREESKKRV